MPTRPYTRGSPAIMDPVHLADQIDTALGRTGTRVDIAGLAVSVSHANLIAADDAQINSVIAAYVFDAAYVSPAIMTASRPPAIDFLLSQAPAAKATRALLSILLDEINLIRAALMHPVTSITRATTVATVTTPSPHGLVVGATVAVFGATLAAYNGVKTVATVPTTTTFTYTVAGSPATPAVGTIVYAMADVPPTPPRTVAQLKAALTAALTSGSGD